ncbi:MAG: DUF302 domain-containing protein [Halobacteriales archaeon]
MPDAPTEADIPEPAAALGMHLTLEVPFDDAVPYVQLEHEYAGYETVAVTRLDEMVRGALHVDVPRTAMLVVCHAEIAHRALDIDQRLAGLLPCATVLYERPADDRVHVHHVSVAKAIRELEYAPAGADEAVDELVELSGEYMTEVWENIEAHADVVSTDGDG